MRRFRYQEPDRYGNCVTITVSEKWIESAFFPKWREFSMQTYNQIPTLEECIDDFTAINWAWEV